MLFPGTRISLVPGSFCCCFKSVFQIVNQINLYIMKGTQLLFRLSEHVETIVLSSPIGYFSGWCDPVSNYKELTSRKMCVGSHVRNECSPLWQGSPSWQDHEVVSRIVLAVRKQRGDRK